MTNILSRWTGAVLYSSATADDIASAVIEARESGADLGGANPVWRDWIIVREPGHITIGCEHHPLEWWREHYKAVGRRERYTDEQVSEYAAHIEYCAAWMGARGIGEPELVPASTKKPEFQS